MENSEAGKILSSKNLILEKKPVKKKILHLDVIDGMRGIAIILVMWFHLWQQSWLSSNIVSNGKTVLSLDFLPVSGFIGVELFFFISGFCLFFPYARHKYENESLPTLKKFVYRRFIKIVPSFYLSMIVMLLVMRHDFGSFSDMVSYVVRNLLFVGSLSHDTYFNVINGVLWSLSVEVQFYVFFPLICWLFRKKPILTFVIISAISIAYRSYIATSNDLLFLFNQLPGVLDLFINGMLAATIVVYLNTKLRKKHLSKRIKLLISLFATLLSAFMFYIFIVMLQKRYDTRFEIPPELWQTQMRQFYAWVFLLMAISSCFAMKWWKFVLGNKFFLFMSIISYNLYIWHGWILLQLKNLKIPYYSTSLPQSDEPEWRLPYFIITIVVSIIIATIITYFFERPLLKKGIKRTCKEVFATFTGLISRIRGSSR